MWITASENAYLQIREWRQKTSLEELVRALKPSTPAPDTVTPLTTRVHVWLGLMHAPDEAWYNVSQGSSFFGLLQGSSLPRWHDACQEINSKLCATSKTFIVALRAEPKLILESLCNLATNTPSSFLLNETHESVNMKFNNAGL